MATNAALSVVKNTATKSSGLRKLLIGRCWPSTVPNSSRIVVKKLDFNQNLKMFFPAYDSYNAFDPDAKCNTGDFVLIEELQQKLTRDIGHQVISVIYPCGDVIDPITGKPCVGNELREDIEWKANIWGKNPHNTFDYDKAPPRGWQKGKKDFSHKAGYRKWGDLLDRDQPEASLY